MPNWTPEQARAHEARMATGRGHSRALSPEEIRWGWSEKREEPPESVLHSEILRECEVRGWLSFHGDMTRRTGRTLGEPDFIIAVPGGLTLWVECKTSTGQLSEDQARIQTRLRSMYHRHYVIRSISEFRSLANSISR